MFLVAEKIACKNMMAFPSSKKKNPTEPAISDTNNLQ